MKRFRKLLALVMAVCMVCAVSATAWAEEPSSNEKTFDLSLVTEDGQIIFQKTEILPDGTTAQTTLTATRPITLYSGSTTTTLTNTYSKSNSTDGVFATLTLSADVWYNKTDKVVGWSGATADVWIDSGVDLIKRFTGSEPYGEGNDSPIVGSPWVKVSTDWIYEQITGRPSSGTLWVKITSDGKASQN